MKNLRHNLTFKAIVLVIITQIGVLSIIGMVYDRQLAAQMNRLVKNQILLPANLINDGVLKPRLVSNAHSKHQLVNDELREPMRQLFIAGSLVALAASIIIIIAAFKLTVSKRIAATLKTLKKVANNDLNSRVADPISTDEIGNLQKGFNSMVDELQRSIHNLEAEVSERKRTEDALRVSEERYRGLFENAPVSLWVEDLSQVKAYTDKLRRNGVIDFKQHFEYHPEEITKCMSMIKVLDINKRSLELYQSDSKKDLLWNIDKILPDEMLSSFSEMFIAIANNEVQGELEITNRTLADDLLHLYLQWFVAPGSRQRYDRIFLALMDLTDRIKVEREKIQLEEQLLQAQKMESIGTLAGGISHDFNNILQAISGYSQLLLFDKRVDDSDYKSLNEINNAALKASELTQQLLTFSRKVKSNLKPTNLNNEIRAIKDILERTIPKMVHIQLHLNKDIQRINADENQIEQILMNLGINASQAMPEGGRLIFETASVKLDDEYCRGHLGAEPGDFVLVTVSDTGSGMDKETLGHIFEPFFTTKETGSGTGLGLAMVYGIVKNHGGYIMCYSEPGQGSCFKIYFPALSALDSPIRQKIAFDADIPSGSETILMVDDDAALLNLGKNMLERFAYTVLTASSGEAALEAYHLRCKEVALVILDLNMPGMGGRRCLQELLQINPDLKVIIASGYSPHGSVGDTLAEGAKGFVGKPYQLKDILITVRNTLDTS